MAEEIKDGTGTGNKMRVNSKNQASTFSVVETEDKSINRDGRQWSLSFSTTPVGAGDYFFYLENTGTVDITITDIRTMCAAAETIDIDWVSGTPSYTADADITPVPKNGGSSKIPTAIAKLDTDITGLTDGGKIFFQRLDTANKMEHIRTSANIIIPQGTALGLKATTGTALITCTVSIVELD